MFKVLHKSPPPTPRRPLPGRPDPQHKSFLQRPEASLLGVPCGINLFLTAIHSFPLEARAGVWGPLLNTEEAHYPGDASYSPPAPWSTHIMLVSRDPATAAQQFPETQLLLPSSFQRLSYSGWAVSRDPATVLQSPSWFQTCPVNPQLPPPPHSPKTVGNIFLADSNDFPLVDLEPEPD